jgi:hypothetical protein
MPENSDQQPNGEALAKGTEIRRRVVRRIEITVERREITLAGGAKTAAEAGSCSLCGQPLPCKDAAAAELMADCARRLTGEERRTDRRVRPDGMKREAIPAVIETSIEDEEKQ